jgi:hypothetical protein
MVLQEGHVATLSKPAAEHTRTLQLTEGGKRLEVGNAFTRRADGQSQLHECEAYAIAGICQSTYRHRHSGSLQERKRTKVGVAAGPCGDSIEAGYRAHVHAAADGRR